MVQISREDGESLAKFGYDRSKSVEFGAKSFVAGFKFAGAIR